MMNIFPGISSRRLFARLLKSEANKVMHYCSSGNAVDTEQSATPKIKHHSFVEKKSEWEMAKPFDQIPGYRSFPVVGTTWVGMPFIGMTC